MMLDVFSLYNITQFLRALVYFPSKASGSFCDHRLWRKLGRNPTELIAEFHFAN
jgi:hypothetical protein